MTYVAAGALRGGCRKVEIGFFDENSINQALAAVLEDPYGNALAIASLTALRKCSQVIGAGDQSGVRGLLSLYDDLPLPAIASWCEDTDLFRSLLIAMTSRLPHLRGQPARCLGSRKAISLLERIGRVDLCREELQMKLDLDRYGPEAQPGDLPAIVSLATENVEDLNALYRIVPPEAWRPEEVGYGPYRGIFEGEQLVAAAGVHWVSPWIAEIGNVGVHPAFRRRGLAEACVRAVIEDLRTLTERIYLMVFADNEPAIRLYRKMGFEEAQRMWLVQFEMPKDPDPLWNLETPRLAVGETQI